LRLSRYLSGFRAIRCESKRRTDQAGTIVKLLLPISTGPDGNFENWSGLRLEFRRI